MSSKVLFFFIVSMFGSHSYADILFIRLNPADGEIAAARSVAKSRGENLIVIPPVEASTIKTLQDFDKEEARLLKKAENLTEIESVEPISNRMMEIQNEREALVAQIALNPQTLKDSIVALGAAHIRLSSVVISGHDGNGKYWGAVGQPLSFDDFVTAFRAAPLVISSVRSVALLGCYTSTLSALESFWKKVFPPNAAYAGYEFKGPNATVPSGHEYLKAFLMNDEKFVAAKSKQEVQRLFNKLPQIKVLAASIGVGQYHVSNVGVNTIDELYAKCDGVLDSSELRTSYNCYYEAKPGCEDVPTDTKSGPIRKFYERVQQTAHCVDIVPLVDGQSIPEHEVVLSMIFFNNIRDNFVRLYRQDLIVLNQWMKAIGVDEIDFAGKSRGEIMKAVRDRRARTMPASHARPQTADAMAAFILRYKIQARLEQIDRILLRLIPSCVPSAWVDPLVAGKSACFRDDAFLARDAANRWSDFVRRGSK